MPRAAASNNRARRTSGRVSVRMRLLMEPCHSITRPPPRRGGRAMYVLRSDKRFAVLNMLVEGNSIRSTERITGVHRDTIMRLLVRAGEHCRDFLDERMTGLRLNHLECDEIWTFVGIKQGHIREGMNDSKIG